MKNNKKREIGLSIEKYIISKFELNNTNRKDFFDAYDSNNFIYEIKGLMLNCNDRQKRFGISKEAHEKILNYMSFYIFVLYEYKNKVTTIKQIEKVDSRKVDIWINGNIYGRVRPEVLFDLDLNLSEIVT